MKRAAFALSVFIWVVLGWLWVIPGQASATVEGPCTATVAGQDVSSGHDTASTAIDVPSGKTLSVGGTSQGQVQDLSYTVNVAGAGFQTGSVTVGFDGRSWSGSVPIEKVSAVTVGLFEVTADVQTDAGSCTAKVFICITGKSPLATAAGAGATAVGLGGLLLLGLAVLRPRRMKAVGSVVSSLTGGATAALGATVLLQQTCIVPLTMVTAAAVPAAAGVGGLVMSSVARRLASRGARRAIRAGHPAGPGGPGSAGAPGGPEPTSAAHEVVAGHGAGAPQGGEHLADAGRAAHAGGGGPAPASPGGTPGGGPAPASPGGTPGGGPAPASPGGTPGGGPAPAPPGGGQPSAPPTAAPPAEGGLVVPPILPGSKDQTQTCSNCGAENGADVQFCTSCGTRLSEGEGG